MDKRAKKLSFLKLEYLQFVFAPLLALVYVVIALFFAPEFLSLQNLNNLLYSSALLLPATLGMQFLLIAGRFDLSTGSVAALTGIISGLCITSSLSVFLSILIGLGVAGFIGVIVGSLITFVRVEALIATLAAMGVVRSFALGIPNGQTVSNFPSAFEAIAQGVYFGVDKVIWYGAALLLFCDFMCRRNVACRQLYSIGNNAWAAACAGINVEHLTVTAYFLAALGAGLTGILQTSRAMAASPLVFQDLALDAIAACIIGGASLRGGRGSMLGAALGLLIVVATRNLVVMLNVSVYWRYAVIGTLLLSAALLDAIIRSKRS